MTSFELSLLLQKVLECTEYTKAPRDLSTYLDSHYSLLARLGIALVSQEISSDNAQERLLKAQNVLKEVMHKVTSEKPAQMFVSLDRWMAELHRENDSLRHDEHSPGQCRDQLSQARIGLSRPRPLRAS